MARVLEARLRLDAELLNERDKKALELAARYADGWRPEDSFGTNDEDQEEDGASNADDPSEAVGPSEREGAAADGIHELSPRAHGDGSQS